MEVWRRAVAVGRRALASPWLRPLNDADALDDLLALANPLWSVRAWRARVVRVIDETPDARTFVLRPNRRWGGFVAGQHVCVAIEIDGVRHERAYSLSSRPGEPTIAVTVKRQPGGRVSNFLHDAVRPGHVLALGRAAGRFVVPDPPPTRLLMLSAGSGITPVRSILRDLHARRPATRIRVHGRGGAARSHAPYPARAGLGGTHDLPLRAGGVHGDGAGDVARGRRRGAPALGVVHGTRAGGQPGRARDRHRHLRALGRRVRGGRGSPAPRGSRAQRPPSTARVPDGDLPHVSLPEGERHGREPRDRRRLVRAEHHDPALHLRRPLGSHPGALTPHPERRRMTSTALPLPRSAAQAIEAELDRLRAEIVADLGAPDAAHIRRMIRLARLSALAGRTLLMLGVDPLTWGVGVTALATAKILENMEIGHNVMHGQYDWMNDPVLCSQTYEWDNVCDGEQWRHSHNVVHHTHTNILGRDRDVGYGFLRVSDAQPWRPHHLFQPAASVLLALLFEWGVGLHDLELDEWLRGRRSSAEVGARLTPF